VDWFPVTGRIVDDIKPFENTADRMCSSRVTVLVMGVRWSASGGFVRSPTIGGLERFTGFRPGEIGENR